MGKVPEFESNQDIMVFIVLAILIFSFFNLTLKKLDKEFHNNYIQNIPLNFKVTSSNPDMFISIGGFLGGLFFLYNIAYFIEDKLLLIGVVVLNYITASGLLSSLQTVEIKGSNIIIRNKKLKTKLLNIEDIKYIQFHNCRYKNITYTPSLCVIGFGERKHIDFLRISIKNYIYIRKFFIAHGIKVVDEYGVERGWFPKED